MRTVGKPRIVRGRLARLLLAAVATGSLVLGGTVVAQSAWADDYPSWADVEAARNNEAATQAAIAQINAALAGLQATAASTQADAAAKGTIWQDADAKYQTANARAENLQKQADAANAIAKASEQRVGQLAAQLMRSGGGDVTVTLFANFGNAANLLYGLGMSSKISEQANALYDHALQDKNTAQSLTDQADVAKNELASLREVAQKAFTEAQTAATAAATALQAQQDNQARLQQQLIVLTQNLAGAKAKFSANASLDAGQISDSGWVKPASGPITSGYGWRILYGASNFHKGTDLGANCDSPIYAASSGTVIYAAYGWNGGYGNFIIIDHGNGLNTAYGHIVDGGIMVNVGDAVGVGEQIARVGSTGNSTGCHLHFEVRIDGNTTDPVPYMANQGITLG
jgi:murein DD-endopeptidase MepM/ murein hydrolase activator NlpD